MQIKLASWAKCGLVLAMMVGAQACAAPPADAPETNAEAIIGGVPVTSKKLDAVGAMLITIPGQATQAFCTGTLIAPNLVMTAKHCAILHPEDSPDGQEHKFMDFGEVAFGIGSNAAAPTKKVKAVSVQVTALNEGGAGFGSDVSVYTLSEDVTDVTPLPVATGPLQTADVGAAYVAIGYGVSNAAGASGVRTMGNITLSTVSGSAWHTAFPNYDDFKAWIETQVGHPLTPDELTQVQAMYDQPLLDQYEAFFGAKDGDVQACSGDSGGPLLRKVGDQITVFGVASWVPEKVASSMLCARGVVYSMLGPSAQDLLNNSRSTCGEPLVGRCDGTTAVRCTAADEGGAHVTRTRCDELGLICGMIDGKAGCVE